MAEQLSPRLEELRKEIVGEIPCKPSTNSVRQELEQRSFADLLMVFFNWAQRLIPPRRRQITFANGFWSDTALARERDIYTLANRMRLGEDVTPFLSSKIHCDGYTPRNSKRRGVEWGDKDFALNAFGTHHIHLTQTRTRELVYAVVRRDMAEFIHFGDHKSFDDGRLEAAVVQARADTGHMVLHNVLALEKNYTPQERTKLARYGLSTFANVGGIVVISTNLSTAGTSDFLSVHVSQALRTLWALDEKFETAKGRAELGPEINALISDPKWTFWFNDLCVVDRNTKKAVMVLPGRL